MNLDTHNIVPVLGGNVDIQTGSASAPGPWKDQVIDLGSCKHEDADHASYIATGPLALMNWELNAKYLDIPIDIPGDYDEAADKATLIFDLADTGITGVLTFTTVSYGDVGDIAVTDVTAPAVMTVSVADTMERFGRDISGNSFKAHGKLYVRLTNSVATQSLYGIRLRYRSNIVLTSKSDRQASDGVA